MKLFLKRFLDLVSSGLGLLILSPLFLLLILWIRAIDRGPAFYAQTRVGLSGRLFKMWKFRSMRVDADKMGLPLTVGDDPRITKVGRVLRKTKLDELPQLWNVFRGQMSLVGPRPEVEKYVNGYSEPERAVLNLKPGITDPASLVMYDESTLLAGRPDAEDFYKLKLVPEKIRINLEYAAKAGMFTDLLVIFATLGKATGVAVDILKILNIANSDLTKIKN
jgi:lipopolysaccharide/colanic/teichoic acid biosynthesis glycosyltransferase